MLRQKTPDQSNSRHDVNVRSPDGETALAVNSLLMQHDGFAALLRKMPSRARHYATAPGWPPPLRSHYGGYAAWIWSLTVARPSLNGPCTGGQFAQPMPRASGPILPLGAVAHACLTAVSGMRTIACVARVSFYVNSLTLPLTPVSAGGYLAMARPLWHGCPFVRD
jgi:hypothetical protein